MKNKIDLNEYIGVAETPIELSKFNNLPEKAKVPGNIFGFDPYGDETQFYVVNENECIILGEPTEYVTEEQIKNNNVFIINHKLYECNKA